MRKRDVKREWEQDGKECGMKDRSEGWKEERINE